MISNKQAQFAVEKNPFSSIQGRTVGFYTIGNASLPSTWFRVLQYFPYLQEAGVRVKHFGLSPTRGNSLRQLAGLTRQGLVRASQLACASSCDILLVQKGLTPCRWRGMVNRLLSSHVPYVLDIDDAVYMPMAIRLPGLLGRMQDPEEFLELLRHARHVIAGNRVIEQFVLQYRSDITVLPTPIDTDTYRLRPDLGDKKPIIGWSGSSSTNILVNRILPVLNVLAQKFQFTFLIISNDLNHICLQELTGVRVQFVPWKKETEVQDLSTIDIGLMPLDKNDEWSRAKCGLKALQYMALGIPTVCSPVGINTEIITDGVNGLLADGQEEWISKLGTLLKNPAARRSLGERGRKTVQERYSVKVLSPKFLEVLEGSFGNGKR